ncbi:prothymosin alpha isoform X4 [Myotis myotis]|uniref:prothymosin alpha isoform X4 n=1 Tax=Myotis myotis TaxID=51298 RepID=UPI00174E3F15|nr:prothymosin alpha isoform X4 [Myotis myotis]XP_059559500.1 prothymosin alpha isoform X4 [Myotis daubentonii]
MGAPRGCRERPCAQLLPGRRGRTKAATAGLKGEEGSCGGGREWKRCTCEWERCEEEDGDEDEEAEAATGKRAAEDDEDDDVDTKKQKTDEDD